MTNRHKLGEIGENLVAQLLNATKSNDRYDQEKDMVVDDNSGHAQGAGNLTEVLK